MMFVLQEYAILMHLLFAVRLFTPAQAVPVPTGPEPKVPLQALVKQDNTSPNPVQPTHLRLFGNTFQVSPPVQEGASHREEQKSKSKSHKEPGQGSTEIPHYTWLHKYVESEDIDKYRSLLKKMKIYHKDGVRRNFIRSLDDKEKEAIRTEDEEGIKKLLSFRGHLAIFAPELYPAHLRPDEKRLERVQKKINKVKTGVSGRFKKKGWYNEHTMAEAEQIRKLTMHLYKQDKFHHRLNDRIKLLNAKERKKALQGDNMALYKLGPKNKAWGFWVKKDKEDIAESSQRAQEEMSEPPQKSEP